MTKFISKENLQTYHDLLKPEIDKKLNTPESGEAGQVLTKTEDGIEWKDPFIEDKVELNIENGTGINSLQQKTCTAKGQWSHAEGNSTVAEGSNSHSEGVSTKAIGPCSHAEGASTAANGANSHAEGGGTIANGAQSHAEGSGTSADGIGSHAEGIGTSATNNFTHAEGGFTKATNMYEHAEGQYNKSNSEQGKVNTISSIGIGANDINRKNAQEVMQNGDFYVFGIGGYDGTNPYESQTLQEVVNNPDISSQLGDYATKEEVSKAKSDVKDELIGTAPGTYDTLGEIAEYIEKHGEVAAGMAESIASKADKSELDGYVKKTGDDITGQIKITSDNDRPLRILTGKDNNWNLIAFSEDNSLTLGYDKKADRFGTSGNFASKQLISLATEGTAPFVVNSNTLVNKLNADLLDGLHGNNLLRLNGAAYAGATTIPNDADLDSYLTSGTYIIESDEILKTIKNRPANALGNSRLIVFNNTGADGKNDQYGWQFFISTNGQRIYVRSIIPSGFQEWITITDKGNADSSTKLATPRTLWGQSFDGTQNVSGDMTGLGDRIIASDGRSYMWYSSDGHTVFGDVNPVEHPVMIRGKNVHIQANVGNNAIFVSNSNNYVGIGTTSPSYKLDVNGAIHSNTRVISPKTVYKTTTAGSVSIDAANYDVAVITLNGNVSGVTLSSMPQIGQDVSCILYGGDTERTVAIANTSTYKTSTGEDLELTVPANGYVEVNFLYDGDKVWVRGV